MANNRTYEEYEPAVEWSRSAEADAVKLWLQGKQSIPWFFFVRKSSSLDHAWLVRRAITAIEIDRWGCRVQEGGHPRAGGQPRPPADAR